MSHEYLNVLSAVIGWVYFFAWSFSFYPQSILNWKKKSVAGFSLEFALLNVSGFFFYSLYSIGGFTYSHLGTGSVEPNDLVFALHAFLLSSVQFSQAFIYERGKQKSFALWAVVLLICEWITLITVFFLEGVIDVGVLPVEFNSFRVAGYNKAIITFVKYLPQVYLNYSRKSTVGWSITNIMLDFTGGSLSILQQVIDMLYEGANGNGYDFFGSGGDAFNIVKFLLGAIACFFDIIFITQHFILYPHAEKPAIPDEDQMKVVKPVRHSILAEEEDPEDDVYHPIANNPGESGKINHTNGNSSNNF